METAANATGFGPVVRREWQRLRRDTWDLGMLTWIPLGVCLLIWWMFAAGIARDLPVVAIDRDQSSLSRSLLRMLDGSPGVRVAATVASEAEATAWLRERRAYGLVVVPASFQHDILAGRSATVSWFYNGQFSVHAGGLTRDVRTAVSTLSAGIEMTARGKRGASPAQAAEQFEPIRLRLGTLYNENANYESFLVLALIPSMLQIFVALAAITAIGRELRAGTVPQWLESAGGGWGKAVAGKLLIPAVAFALQTVLFVIFFGFVRGWAIEGSGVMIVVGLWLLIAAYLGLGLLMIAVTLTLRNALSAAAFVTAPAFAFSGQGYPLSAMPTLARAWAEALPLTHYLQLQGKHWLAGAPWTYGVGDALILLGFAVVGGGAGLLILQRRAGQASAWGRT